MQHLYSYPAFTDSVNAIKENPLGKKSLDLSNTGYEKLISPFVPYAKGPYGYLKPYVEKGDSLAADGLTKIDDSFPILKKDTETIKGTILDFAFFPFRVANDGKDHIFDTYGSEYKKCGGDGYVAGTKAMVTTGLVVTSDTLSWLSSFLGKKKDEGSDYAAKKYGQASDYVSEKSDAATAFANEKAEQTKKFAYQKKDEAKDAAGQAKQTTEQKGSEAKQSAKEKSGQ